MKERKQMRGWWRFALAALLTIGVAAPAGLLLNMALPGPAFATSELHPGGRLFFPAWDVRGNTLSFLVITRLATFEQNTDGVQPAEYSQNNNCRPGHGTSAFPTVGGSTTISNTLDDVHLEWYGKSCDKRDEIIPMSCGDVDIIFLDSANLSKHVGAGTINTDRQGALDVHFIINVSPNNVSQDPKKRVLENSLMGHGIISNQRDGWALVYPAASAKATQCNICGVMDGGTAVGYEPFPTELFIPFAFADGSEGGLRNLLYLWAPTFFPGDDMPSSFGINWAWYDGRERRHVQSGGGHAVIDNLKDLDTRFDVANFVCGHTADVNVAENDGAPRSGTADSNGECSGASTTDTVHTSDNAQTPGSGAAAFKSIPVGWWDILKTSETAPSFTGLASNLGPKIRGLVGVVAASTNLGGFANEFGDAIRLWHKDPCHRGPLLAIGPPHVRDRSFRSAPSYLVGFNLFGDSQQRQMCRGEAPSGGISANFNDDCTAAGNGICSFSDEPEVPGGTDSISPL